MVTPAIGALHDAFEWNVNPAGGTAANPTAVFDPTFVGLSNESWLCTVTMPEHAPATVVWGAVVKPSFVGVAEQKVGEPESRLLVQPHQRLPGSAIAPAGAQNQVCARLGWLRWLSRPLSALSGELHS